MVEFQNAAGFTEKDAANLERVKDAMAERAVGKAGVLESGPDAAAAAAFAQLLEAETNRERLMLERAGKAATAPEIPALPEMPAAGSWVGRAAEARQPETVMAQA